MDIELPPDVPSGFCWSLNDDETWTLQETEPATLYKIMIDGRYHCGYFEREIAERFLPDYQRQYPNAVVTIEEQPDERPVEREDF